MTKFYKPICNICGKEINEKIIPCNLNNEHFHQKCYDNSPAGKKALKEFNTGKKVLNLTK